MSKVIIFSEYYPKHHPKAGEKTFFPEKILAGLDIGKCVLWTVTQEDLGIPIRTYYDSLFDNIVFFRENIKHHTIRRGNRWKVGDWFSPRVWSGKQYRSKQIQFAPDIQVKKVWDIIICRGREYVSFKINTTENGNSHWIFLKDIYKNKTLALNDGLDPEDFVSWFKVVSNAKKSHEFFAKLDTPHIIFSGQIICWNDKIIY